MTSGFFAYLSNFPCGSTRGGRPSRPNLGWAARGSALCDGARHRRAGHAPARFRGSGHERSRAVRRLVDHRRGGRPHRAQCGAYRRAARRGRILGSRIGRIVAPARLGRVRSRRFEHRRAADWLGAIRRRGALGMATARLRGFRMRPRLCVRRRRLGARRALRAGLRPERFCTARPDAAHRRAHRASDRPRAGDAVGASRAAPPPRRSSRRRTRAQMPRAHRRARATSPRNPRTRAHCPPARPPARPTLRRSTYGDRRTPRLNPCVPTRPPAARSTSRWSCRTCGCSRSRSRSSA